MLSYSYIKASNSLKTVWIRALAFNALLPSWTFLIQVSQINCSKKSLKNSFFCEKSIKSCCPNKFSRALKFGTIAKILRAKESLKISKLAMFEPKRDARNVIAKNCNDSLFKSSQHFSARAALHLLLLLRLAKNTKPFSHRYQILNLSCRRTRLKTECSSKIKNVIKSKINWCV